jgi:ATP-binding cassette subfamily B protein
MSPPRERNPQRPIPPTPPLRQALLAALRAVGLVWQGGRGLVLGYFGTTIVDALCPAAIAYVGKVIIDRVMARDRDGALAMVALELVLVLAQSSAYRLREYLDVRMRGRLLLKVQGLILGKVLGQRLWHFEDPEFLDKLERARNEAGMRPLHLLQQAFSFVKHVVRLVSYGFLLWSFSPVAVMVIALSVTPQFLAQARHARAQFGLGKARTFESRRNWYLQRVLADDDHVKEIKLFGLGQLLYGRYRARQESFFAEDAQLSRRWILWSYLAGWLTSGALYGCYGMLIIRAAGGQLTIGEMTLYLVLFRSGQSAFEEVLSALVKIFESSLYIQNLYEFLALPDDEPDAPVPAEPWLGDGPYAGPPAIRFEGVSFHYPGSERPVLEGVDLEIRGGETLALVGANGAGKTTLIKLLLRLQEPTAGRVLVDGVDVRDLEPAKLRSRIGVIFQDFIHFHFPLAENVGVGWLPSLGDRAAVDAAATLSGASEVAAGLPQGMDTMLGRYYGGENLSIGQWQKVALGRAFMRRGDIVVLDEPTAAIDAEAEQEIFDRFKKLDAGRTCILITHRFSTVRMADRIAVLHQGKLAELGSHEELMAKDGRYARLFRIQAAGYQLGVDDVVKPAEGAI